MPERFLRLIYITISHLTQPYSQIKNGTYLNGFDNSLPIRKPETDNETGEEKKNILQRTKFLEHEIMSILNRK